MKNVLKPLSKSVLVPLGLTVAASQTDVVIQMKIFGSGTTSIFPDEEMNHIMKIVKSHEGPGLLKKEVRETTKVGL